MMNLLFALIVWFGQTAVPPTFEVASIKESRPPSSMENIQGGQFHFGISVDGSRADYGFMSLADLIPYAYRVKRFQLAGPSWISETRWDILARIPDGQPAVRAPEMMQNLLGERFKLSIHRENREQSVYALVVGRGGSKLKQASAAEEAPGADGGLNMRINNDGTISTDATGTIRMTPSPDGVLQLQMAKMTMGALADRLTQFMDRPVVDATGLKGNYQVTLDLPVEALRGLAFAQKLATVAGLTSFGFPDVDTSRTPIIKSMKDLGLDLESRKAPIETIIVDRLEKTPTAN
jgi:uncharacterized protein (TIGR03435 family)